VMEGCRRDRSWAQSWAVLEMKEGIEVGSRDVTKERAAGVGTITIGRTHERGFRLGSVRASDGIPGSMDNQEEKTFARGWALRPESTLATEVVKERIDEVGFVQEPAGDMAEGIAATIEAGQLVKATRSMKAFMGSAG
jgi:hypothetical protein